MTLSITRTVYSVYLPETRRIVEALWAERPHGWYERNYEKKQDAMHRPCLERWRAWAGAAGVTLGASFAHEYPTSGASEAIHALLALQAARGERRVHVFDGEYEGYGHIAAALGLEVVAHRRDEASPVVARGDTFWISQPSAIDGNLWTGFAALCDAVGSQGGRLVVDLTYVGATAIEPRVMLDHPAVSAVVWSLSKPFGVYYHRVGGALAKEEIPTLTGSLWFKNLFSLHLGERLMATYAARELPAMFLPRQRDALVEARASSLVPEGTRPSDVVLLAHAPHTGDARFAEYARGQGLRFCLSPSLDRSLNG